MDNKSSALVREAWRISKFFPLIKPGHGSTYGKDFCNAKGCDPVKHPEKHYQRAAEAAKKFLVAQAAQRKR